MTHIRHKGIKIFKWIENHLINLHILSDIEYFSVLLMYIIFQTTNRVIKENVMQRKKEYLDPPKILVLGFLMIILLGSFLLTLPMSTTNGQGLPFLNALFTATSATCVTGLVVVDTGTTFTLIGQVIILCLIQVGGLGFMTFATFFAFLLGKKISLKERIILQESLNNLSMEGIVRLARRIVIFTAVIEFTGAVLLSI